MRTETSQKTRALQPSFATGVKTEIHHLQPGRSMLIGYPDTEHANKVFLVMQITDEKGVILLQTNGNVATMTLKDVVKQVIDKDMTTPCEKRVMFAGEMNSNGILLATPQDWSEEQCSIDIGVCRIHNYNGALQKIASGDIPEKLAVFAGFTGFSYADFMGRVQNNEFGEIAYQEDMVFGEELSGTLQWNKAMSIHTGGHNASLFVPHPTNGKNVPRPC